MYDTFKNSIYPQRAVTLLGICMLGYCLCFCCRLLIFFSKIYFRNTIGLSNCLVLVWVKAVCMQTTKAGASKELNFRNAVSPDA